jgi:UDP-glucose 4-epimerase
VRVLVTGGAGFIGSHVVDRLVAHGHEPRVYDLVAPRRHAAGQVDSVVGDILTASALRDAMAGCAAVIHLAAVADVEEVAADPLHADLVNTRGTAVVLEAARLEGIRHFVYGSTIWVYGSVPGGAALDEEMLLGPPEHFYTATKLAGETYCRAYARMFGLAPTILRFGIPHGPRARSSTVVARFVARALAGESLSINGDGNQTRHFVYVEDLAEGVVASLTTAARNRTFNLVGDETVSVSEIAAIVRELIGNVSIEHLPGRQADLGRLHISGQRAWDELGWRPTTAFADGVARYIASLAPTNGSASASTAVTIAGKAATVLRHEPGAL